MSFGEGVTKLGSKGRKVWRRSLVVPGLLIAWLSLVGCGPAPGYEAEAQAPVGPSPIEPLAPRAPEPASPTMAVASPSSPSIGAPAPDGTTVDVSDGTGVDVGLSADEYADTDPSALTDFKPALDGHGAWVDDPTYGTVWVPNESEVGSDFVPYVSAGHWTYDDADSWVWVSDYSWGWAPFHYGRWVQARRHGWAWIPGRTYAGAWVVWRTGLPGYGYVGWSPAPPDWYWYNGYAVAWTFGWSPYYSYCSPYYMYGPGLGHHVVRGGVYDSRTAPYRQSAPPAGRVVASPGVGGRVVAKPGVGDRVAASPSVGDRSAARPRVVGPSPGELGIDRTAVPAPSHQGFQRAKAFATPSTAVALGAAEPNRLRPRPLATDTIASTRAFAPSSSLEPVARAPQYTYGPAPTSRPIGSNPAATTSPVARPYTSNSRVDSVAPVVRSPQYTNVTPRPTPIPRAPIARGTTVLPDLSHRPSRYTAPGLSAPSGVTSTASAPLVPRETSTFRPSQGADARVSSPSFRPSPGTSSPVFRPSQGADARVSSPSFRPSPSVSSPVFRPSPSVSSPSFRSSPSVSMPRASSPAIRSTPSVSAPRSSAPSHTVQSRGSIRRR